MSPVCGIFHKGLGPTDGPTDGRTDRRTTTLLELLRAAKNERNLKTYLFALGTFEWALSLVLVLPHVIVQVALCHKLFLADLARPRLHSVVFNPEDRNVKHI